MEGTFERVHTVHDYYDGPRGGFADFGGMPHAYRSIWRDDVDSWDAERFELSPVSAEQMAIVMEDWAIWCRWEEALYAGMADESTHPALPADRARHDELAPRVEAALEIDPARRRIARGEFRAEETPHPPGPPTRRARLRVRWTPVE